MELVGSSISPRLGVRKTFVDCCAVRSILRGYGVRLDERDVSMHAVFKAELADLLGPGFAGAALPRVFVDGQYLGGAEDVHFLHEAGEVHGDVRRLRRRPVRAVRGVLRQLQDLRRGRRRGRQVSRRRRVPAVSRL